MVQGKNNGGRRLPAVKVKTAKRRKISSTLWLQRQLNDPYVISAKKEGYRSRAVYKLMEIADKHKLLRPGITVVDLGAAPGSWTQLAVERIGGKGRVVAVDIQEIEPMAGIDFILGDFSKLEVQNEVSDLIPDKAELILSDMAPSSTGHASTDHLRIMGLADEALEFVKENTKKGGNFLIKLLKGGSEEKYAASLRQYFKKVKFVKPKASRENSREIFILAEDFKA